MYNYIYIPKELTAEQFTRLHNREFQVLMGKTLTETLDSFIPPNSVNKINESLDKIIESIEGDLSTYTYRTITSRQQKLKKADIYTLITDAYFGIRFIHQKFGDDWIPISKLSSGEKQKAILNIAHTLLQKNKESNSSKYIIFGFDEPESSLHISACFDIFQQLYDTSNSCTQLIFTTHWYGFIPSVIDGNTVVLSKNNKNEHHFDFINISKYREQARQLIAQTNNSLPSSIKLKSINDLVQSIVCGSMGEKPFNWIICEGSSEKIYFSHFFKDLISNKRLRILPVGGYKEVKKLYSHLSICFEEFKHEITGKVFLLCDTDSQLDMNINPLHDNKHPKLKFRRFINNISTQTTELVSIDNSTTSSPTEIEHVLNASTFIKTLELFKVEYPNELKNLVASNYYQCPIGFHPSEWSLSLNPLEQKTIFSFFDLNQGGMKLEFAEKYVENVSDLHEINWINEIRDFLEN